MHIGPLNSVPTFVAMYMNLQKEWDTLSKEHGLKIVASKIIFDDMLLYGRAAEKLLDYFITVLNILKHHRAILKLKRCKWFQDRFNFVGMDTAELVTKTVQYKREDFANLE